MPNTPNGYPYPLDTDPLAAGAAAVQALATKVDTALRATASGRVTLVLSSAVTTSAVVTFPAGRFGSTVPVGVAGGVNSTVFIGSIGTVTATSMTLSARYYLGTATSATFDMAWIASSPG